MVLQSQQGPLQLSTLSDKMNTGCEKTREERSELRGNYSSLLQRDYVCVDKECR